MNNMTPSTTLETLQGLFSITKRPCVVISGPLPLGEPLGELTGVGFSPLPVFFL